MTSHQKLTPFQGMHISAQPVPHGHMSPFLHDNSSSKFDFMSELDVELPTQIKKDGVSHISLTSPVMAGNDLWNEVLNHLPRSCGTPPPNTALSVKRGLLVTHMATKTSKR